MQARVGREAVTYGMRTGEMEGILHGARWAQRETGMGVSRQHDEAMGKGCPMGCGAQCTLKHVVLGECIACNDIGTRKRLVEMQRAVTEMDDEVVRPKGVRGNGGARTAKGGDEGQGAEEGARMSAQEREDARGAAWGSQLRAVRRAITSAMAGKCTEEGDSGRRYGRC